MQYLIRVGYHVFVDQLQSPSIMYNDEDILHAYIKYCTHSTGHKDLHKLKQQQTPTTTLTTTI